MDQKQNNMEAMIERYKSQLMDMKKQAGQRGVDPGVYTQKASAPQEMPDPQQAFPGAVVQEVAAPASPETPPAPPEPMPMEQPPAQPESTPPPAALPEGTRTISDERFSRLPTATELTGQGYIKVQVYLAKGAMPVAGARVSIRQDGTELTATVTNENGETAEIPLKAPPKALSEQYETAMRPYSVYDVYTDKDGFVPVRNLNVPVFDGIVSIQGVGMRRLPEDYHGEKDTYDESSLPQE